MLGCREVGLRDPGGAVVSDGAGAEGDVFLSGEVGHGGGQLF